LFLLRHLLLSILLIFDTMFHFCFAHNTQWCYIDKCSCIFTIFPVKFFERLCLSIFRKVFRTNNVVFSNKTRNFQNLRIHSFLKNKYLVQVLIEYVCVRASSALCGYIWCYIPLWARLCFLLHSSVQGNELLYAWDRKYVWVDIFLCVRVEKHLYLFLCQVAELRLG